jgi:4-amino-4-deoxy-L-arabinose transferase-like glycosyltransferase
MKQTNLYLFLIPIFFLAIFLRFWQLGNIPMSLNWDEAAWGYNAYTLGVDGKDEFGSFLPYKFIESYGDYKPPVYAYLSVLPVKLFGLNEFSTRFASAFFGSFSVLIVFFLVRRIFYTSDKKEYYALLSALFLGISPWNINLSRAAFEANVATFFVLTGVWLFLAGIQEKKWYLPFSALMFALSFYTFNSPRIVVPFLGLALVLGTYKKLLPRKREVMIAGLVGIVLLAPLVGFLLSPQAKLRYQEVNIFSDVSIVKGINQEIQNDNNAVWSKILHNRRFIYALTYTKP